MSKQVRAQRTHLAERRSCSVETSSLARARRLLEKEVATEPYGNSALWPRIYRR